MKNQYSIQAIWAITLVVLATCCSNPKSHEAVADIAENINLPAEGFDVEGSDAIAVVLADKVMDAMGGRKNWDATRYLSWNFFRVRKHVWDKQTGQVRIESQKSDLTILMNINDKTGKVWKNGQEITEADSISKYLEQGQRMWINDAYWLVMPFKLKDSGVTLTYLGEDSTQTGEEADKIRLTFNEVGVTPQNAYDVWISAESRLVKQWAYYQNLAQDEPNFVLPWGNYQQTGDILLSDDRGDRDLSEVKVLETVPDGLFTEFEVVSI
ncbi:MAG: hypothetical protein KI790_21480 [Cyclobacteriaceae bacterium]|nr:hypothetical protein [Cyclobacteriaceae bacterium HetDA_MAG_MS6]